MSPKNKLNPTATRRWGSGSYLLYASGTSVLMGVSPTNPGDAYKWIIDASSDGTWYKIRNAATQTCLKVYNSTLSLGTYSSSDTSYRWRLADVSSYVNLTGFTASDLILCLEDSATTNITKNNSNAYWTSNTDFTWSSADSNIASVSQSGVVTGVSYGQTTVTAVHKPSGKTDTYTVKVLALPREGVYYFDNYRYSTCMQIDDNASPSQSGAKFELWEFSRANVQKWNIEYVSGEYYKVTSNASGLAATAPSAENGLITQTTYTENNANQLWKIVIEEGIYYKLMPQSNPSLYIGATATSSDSEGQNIKLIANNGYNHEEEWFICDIDGIYGNQEHRTLTTSERDDINCHGYAMLRDDWPEYIDYNTSGIWCYRTHGYWLSLGNYPDITNSVEQTVSENTKEDFEEWLDEEGYIWIEEESFLSNGENRIIRSNQYRVALRTGIEYLPDDTYKPTYDYHFWYQTLDGTWSNKHGREIETNLGEGVTPFSTDTSGWDLGDFDNFYDGELYVYIITVVN